MPYRVSKYDHEHHNSRSKEWTIMAEASKLIQLRPVIRDLLAMGYDMDATILVEKIPEFTQLIRGAAPIVSMRQYDARRAKKLKQGELFR